MQLFAQMWQSDARVISSQIPVCVFSSICWGYVREEIKGILKIRFERAQKNEDCGSGVQTGPEPFLPAVGVPERQTQSALESHLIAKNFFTGKKACKSKAFLAFKHHNTKQVSFEISLATVLQCHLLKFKPQ